MSLPAHLRSLISSAAARVRQDREAAIFRAEHALRSEARAEFQRLAEQFDTYLVIEATPSWEAVQGFSIRWQDAPYCVWGPTGTSPLSRWMREQFHRDGLFPARTVAQTTPEGVVWVWPTHAAALSAVRALDPLAVTA